MAHVKKGELTDSDEWAKHLRPVLKRAFWKAERAEAKRVSRKAAGES